MATSSPGCQIPSNKPNPADVEANQRASTPREWPIYITALALPAVLETMDYTMIATAQPHIASVFNRFDVQSYLGAIYLLTASAYVPIFASMSDLYGRHSTMQISFLLFLVGHAICAGAMNMAAMLAGRAIAGIGTAGIATAVRFILCDSESNNTSKDAWQPWVFDLLNVTGFYIGSPIAGGVISLSFRWVFGINLSCGVISMTLIFFLLRKRIQGSHSASKVPPNQHDLILVEASPFEQMLEIDWASPNLFVFGGILILLGLHWGSTDVWNSPKVVASLVIGTASAAASIFWQNILAGRQQAPGSGMQLRTLDTMTPLSWRISYDTFALQLSAFASGMVMLSILYLLVIYAVVVEELSPLKAGVQILFIGDGMGPGSSIGQFWVRRFRQPKHPIILGTILLPVALGMIWWAIDHSDDSIHGAGVVAGVGLGLISTPLTMHARLSNSPDSIAKSTALLYFFRSLGGAVGVAQCATILNATVRSIIFHPRAAVELSEAGIVESTLMSLQAIKQLPDGPKHLAMTAFARGTQRSFISLVPWCVLSLFGCMSLSRIAAPDPVVQPELSGDDASTPLDEKVSVSTSRTITGNTESSFGVV